MPPAHTISQSRSSDDSSADHFRIRLARADDCMAIHRLIVLLAIDSDMLEKVKTTPEQLRKDGFGDDHSPRFSALVIERYDQTGLCCYFVLLDKNNALIYFFAGTHPLDIVGYSIFNEKYSTWKGLILWIEDIFITEPYRHLGLGGALLRKLSSIAAKSTMDRIEWCCKGDNTNAIAFYKAAGAFDLTAAEDWLLYRFESTKFRQYLDRPFPLADSIKIL